MHLLELPSVLREKLYTTAVGAITPRAEMVVSSKYITPSGAWSNDYADTHIYVENRIGDDVEISFSKTILPEDGFSENTVQVDPVTITFFNPDEYFAVIQKNAIFNPEKVEKIRIVIQAIVGDQIIPLFLGYSTGLPSESEGKTTFTFRPDIYAALRKPVLFERFNGINQYHKIKPTEIIVGGYALGTSIFYDGALQFDGMGGFNTTIDNSGGKNVRLNTIFIKNKAKLGTYNIQFTSDVHFVINYPDGGSSTGSIYTGVVSNYVIILPEYFDSDAFSVITVLDEGTGAGTDYVHVQANEGGVIRTLCIVYYSPSTTEPEGLARTIADTINASATGYTCDYDGSKKVTVKFQEQSLLSLGYFIFVTKSNALAAIDVSAPYVLRNKAGDTISFVVSYVVEGNPVTIAANLLEKGLKNTWGTAPTRPASVAIDWDSFDQAEAAVAGMKIYMDFTNESNEVWQNRIGKKPINCMVAAQKALDHVGMNLSIDTFGFVRIKTPGLIAEKVYSISDDAPHPAVISAEITGRQKANYINFQYGKAGINGSFSRSLIFDDSGGGDKVEQVINLPYFKGLLNETDVEVVATRYMNRIIRPNARFRLVVKPNWGLVIRPGDRFRLILTRQPRFDGFIEVVDIQIILGQPCVLTAIQIGGVTSDEAGQFDVSGWDVDKFG